MAAAQVPAAPFRKKKEWQGNCPLEPHRTRTVQDLKVSRIASGICLGSFRYLERDDAPLELLSLKDGTRTHHDVIRTKKCCGLPQMFRTAPSTHSKCFVVRLGGWGSFGEANWENHGEHAEVHPPEEQPGPAGQGGERRVWVGSNDSSSHPPLFPSRAYR